ncbi:hypothetical protein [Rhodococcus sp. T7]|uniref:hypothetical protein n=1 Tax=Rhodococcus sp. T7 TaxID=627444 RepID=UPI001357DA9F|nr:hypothetical protein [Rhodococcus sp. T7]KAF0957285.1 hypothetical protein MLGJGCBP_09115 [Rhodococcus sp. T7]KAF0965120.1 hypothetical protein MLGJGCBP_01720 [Rhodococcus sp. T7]
MQCHRHSFDYQARTLLADRQEKATRAERTAPYAEVGFIVLDGEPGYQDDSKIHWRYIATAENAEADPRAHITEEQVRQRPDLWGVWVTTDTMYVDVESGKPVEEGDIDWDTFDDPDVEPEEGLRHANSVEERDVYVPQFYFLDVLRAEEAGLVPVNGGRYQFNRAIQLAGFNPANPLPENEEAREAALLAAEETKRVQRRRVRELNKLGGVRYRRQARVHPGNVVGDQAPEERGHVDGNDDRARTAPVVGVPLIRSFAGVDG